MLKLCVSLTLLFAHHAYGVIRFESTPTDMQMTAEPEPTLQGARLRFSAVRPQMNGMKCWGKLYPKAVTGAHVQSDWNFAPWASYGFSFGYTSTTGHTAQWAENDGSKDLEQASCDDLVVTDEASQFVFLPLGLHVGAHFSPFSEKYLGFSLWAGYEEVYYQEVRSPLEDESSGTPSINTGWSGGMRVGASFDVLLNGLDEKSLSALTHTTDFKKIYLSLFSEVTTDLGQERLFITTQKKSDVSFARQSYGVSFIFET